MKPGCFVKRALPYLLAINMDFLKKSVRIALEKETDLGIKICSILSFLYRRRVGAHKSVLVSFIGWHPRKVTFLSSFIHFFEALVPRVAKCAPQELVIGNVFFKQEAKMVYFTDKTGKHYHT